MPPRQAKHWCWTLNNPTSDEEDTLLALGEELPENIAYLVFGRETGEEGTPHLQGYIAFHKKVTFNHAKSTISERAHVEGTKGTTKQAADYCKKDGDFLEYGQLPRGKGGRSDLVAVAEKLKEGKRLRDIAEDHPSALIRYGTGIIRLKNHYRPTREGHPSIWVFWGATGVGKTRRVWEFADVDELWVHPGDRWFDGYDGHKSVLFDDFDGGWFKLTYLLKLLDRYVFQVPVKGGYVWWNPTTIYITANQKPEEWYENSKEEHKRALLRRLREFGTIQHCE